MKIEKNQKNIFKSFNNDVALGISGHYHNIKFPKPTMIAHVVRKTNKNFGNVGIPTDKKFHRAIGLSVPIDNGMQSLDMPSYQQNKKLKIQEVFKQSGEAFITQWMENKYRKLNELFENQGTSCLGEKVNPGQNIFVMVSSDWIEKNKSFIKKSELIKICGDPFILLKSYKKIILFENGLINSVNNKTIQCTFTNETVQKTFNKTIQSTSINETVQSTFSKSTSINETVQKNFNKSTPINETVQNTLSYAKIERINQIKPEIQNSNLKIVPNVPLNNPRKREISPNDVIVSKKTKTRNYFAGYPHLILFERGDKREEIYADLKLKNEIGVKEIPENSQINFYWINNCTAYYYSIYQLKIDMTNDEIALLIIKKHQDINFFLNQIYNLVKQPSDKVLFLRKDKFYVTLVKDLTFNLHLMKKSESLEFNINENRIKCRDQSFQSFHDLVNFFRK